MGTAWSREAAALLECDVEEPQEPSSKDIDYDRFFKDIDELREVRAMYDAAEDTACPKRLPHDFKWWPQDERGVFKDEGIQLGLDGTPRSSCGHHLKSWGSRFGHAASSASSYSFLTSLNSSISLKNRS